MKENIKNINIWDTKLKDDCIFLTTFEELLAFIEKNNKEFKFDIHGIQYPEQKHKCILDQLADINNVSITYTDESHPITILKDLGNQILINPTFFQSNIEKFKNEAKKRAKKTMEEALKNKLLWIYIPDFIIDDEFIDLIIQSKKIRDIDFHLTTISGLNLTEEQIKKLKKSHLEILYQGKKLSTKYAIEYYTYSNLETIEFLNIYKDLTEEEINNFIYINENAKISLNNQYREIDEKKYFEKLVKIFKILETHNRTYNIKIEVKNRESLKQSNLLNYVNNINLIIKNDFYEYTKEEYLKEDERLDKLVAPIKESNLSPYERYLAIYNIVKQFKPYKENNENKEQSRNIRYILNNEYMVCVGYAKLLNILLAKVGISSYMFSIDIDTSYDEGFTQEDKPTTLERHARNIVKIDDDKYGIHGIFVADATWDNDMKNDLYNNSTMTFDRKKEAYRLESLTKEDLLLDFHNLDEFIKKLNFRINRFIKKSYKTTEIEKIIGAYKDIYDEIMKIIYDLDYNKYIELHEKYDARIKKDNISLKEIEIILCDYLTEYATYIIPLSNQAISISTTLDAAINTKKKIKKHSEEELIEEREQIKTVNEKIAAKAFPYTYDPFETRENYLTTAKETKKR